jgi:hypothetical protein
MRISSLVSVGSRNNTLSSSTNMPPSPLAASSLVAHEIPAAPVADYFPDQKNTKPA